MTEMKLKVKGMTCHSCEMLIKDILEDEDVKVKSISHNTGELEISYNEADVDFNEIKRILAEEGHEVI